jgi:hypothetical protein
VGVSMRALAFSFSLTLFVFLAALGYSQLVANSRYLYFFSKETFRWSEERLNQDAGAPGDIVHLARRKALLYDDLIIRSQLLRGLVVNRSTEFSDPLDICDSLLFSAIRWTSLQKLGWARRALPALNAIRTSHVEGEWFRHPQCHGLSLSRDMLTGILMLISQDPVGSKDDLRRLIERIREGGGFFSSGPSYVSYLTPGLGKIMTRLAQKAGIHIAELPATIRDGYSTNEVSLLWIKPGFEAHLAALSLWLELELDGNRPFERANLLHALLNALVSPFSVADPIKQAHEWTAFRLVQIDPRNLFFRYLRFRVIGALNQVVAMQLLDELLAMRQFPDAHLPRSCDRTADYLWQRGSHEYDQIELSCSKSFHGTDFLWMVALLVEAIERPQALSPTSGPKT